MRCRLRPVRTDEPTTMGESTMVDSPRHAIRHVASTVAIVPDLARRGRLPIHSWVSSPMLRPLILLTVLSSTVAAQGPLVEVTRGEPGFRLFPSWSNARCFAHTDGGDLWLLVGSRDPHGDGSDDALRLWRSRDGGESWADRFPVPTAGASVGSVVAEPRSERLHVLWSARGEGEFLSVYYQLFDGAKDQWVGEPERLIDGRGANDQYTVRNVELTPKGTLVVAYSCHRTARPPFRTNWSLGVQVREADAQAWGQLLQINPGSTGVGADVQAHGEVVHFTYRSGTNGFGIYHRALDTETMMLTEHRALSVREDGDPQSSNTSSLLLDQDGNRYALYGIGAPNRSGVGRLELAYGPADRDGPWSRVEVGKDPSLQGGNHNPHQLTLARGPGTQVFAVYSKSADKHRVLYQRVFDHGQPAGEERAVVKAEVDGAYAWVTGVRDTQGTGTVFAAVAGAAPGGAVDRVQLYGLRWPARRFWR